MSNHQADRSWEASPTARSVGVDRRCFLRQFAGLSGMAGGLAGVAFASMAQQEALAAGKIDMGPHFEPKAKRVIWIFLRGGLSHMESFDPKPMLTKYAGKTIGETPWSDVQDPEKLKKVRVVVVNDANGQQRNKIFPLQVGFSPRGQCGVEMSDWFPHIASVADELSFIRSMWTTDDNHGAQVQFHSGRHMLDARVPTIGAWVNYGLGTLNDNLPQFINIGPRFFDVRDGHYLGPAYDSVPLKIDPGSPLPFARPAGDLTAEEQRLQFDLIRELHEIRQAGEGAGDDALAARRKSYELAYHMQTAVPEAVRFQDETPETQQLYGLDQDATRPFGMQLLAARRLAERGVRFIQLLHGPGAAGAWDAHSNLKSNHTKLSKQVDQPTAALIRDLKRRGMLNDTLVVFATEFGRTPGSQGTTGRDHHPYGFSVWMAGGGLKGGVVHGATDELGFHAVEHPHYVTDVHATIMHQLGVDARRLEVPGHKRLERDYGAPIREIIG